MPDRPGPRGAHRSSTPPTPRPRRSRLRLAGLSTVALAVVVGTTLAVASPQAGAATPVYLGAAGDEVALSRSIGAPLSDHAYARFDQAVPHARMITVNGGSWRAVAAAGPGTALYGHIVRWADTIKARSGRVLVAYHHEPEAKTDISLGTSADFVAAYRRVVGIFRARGVQNVLYTWQMTAWAFRAPSTDRRYAAKWYPGNGYVDVVGADAYNWYTCGAGTGKWREFSTLADPVLAFARARGKQAAFPEFGSIAHSRRAEWLANVHRYVVANRASIQALFYFHRPSTVAAYSDCRWPLATYAEFKAYGDMARDSAFSP
jgi:hypothetical protein